MNAKTEPGSSVLDNLKLMLAGAIVISGIVAFYYFPEQSVLIRTGGVIAATALGIFVAMQTTQGRELWHFIQGSRVELRKVVWPNRQETLQTTMAVIVFAIIMGVFFWLLDMLLLWITKSLTGQGV